MMMRLSAVACGALVAGVIGLAAPAADAAVVAYSHAGLDYTLNNGPGGSTVKVNPTNSAWANPPTYKPMGNEDAAWVAPEADDGYTGPDNGTVMTISHMFTLQHAAHLLGEVYADDTAQVVISRQMGSELAILYTYNMSPDGSSCGGGPIGCRPGYSGLIDWTLPSSFASGTYVLDIMTKQVAGSGFGALYSFTVTPIPGAVFLFGPAMAGLGYLGMRRKKNGANDDVTGTAAAA